MKAKIRYFNKPHPLRLHHIHIVPQAEGIWYVSAELSLRGYIIGPTGSSPSKKGYNTHEFYIEDDHEDQTGKPHDWDIRAALILYPETKEESDTSMTCMNIYKHTFHAIIISSKVFGSSWDRYCKNRFA